MLSYRAGYTAGHAVAFTYTLRLPQTPLQPAQLSQHRARTCSARAHVTIEAVALSAVVLLCFAVQVFAGLSEAERVAYDLTLEQYTYLGLLVRTHCHTPIVWPHPLVAAQRNGASL